MNAANKPSLDFDDIFPTDNDVESYFKALTLKLGTKGQCKCKQQSNVKWNDSQKVWQCSSCGRRQSIKSRTFMHNSKVSLRIWLKALFLIHTSKTPLSAVKLQGMLGLSRYETAWYIFHRIRMFLTYHMVRENIFQLISKCRKKAIRMKMRKTRRKPFLEYKKIILMRQHSDQPTLTEYSQPLIADMYKRRGKTKGTDEAIIHRYRYRAFSSNIHVAFGCSSDGIEDGRVINSGLLKDLTFKIKITHKGVSSFYLQHYLFEHSYLSTNPFSFDSFEKMISYGLMLYFVL